MMHKSFLDIFWHIFGLLPLLAAIGWTAVEVVRAYWVPSAEIPGPGVTLAALLGGAVFWVAARLAVNAKRAVNAKLLQTDDVS